MRRSKQLKKQAYAYAWNRRWWLSLIQILQSSVVIIQRPVICTWCSLLLAENDLAVGSRDTLHVVPELPRYSRLSTTPYCQVTEGSVSRPEPSNTIQSALLTFHVASMLDYDHLRGFYNLSTNSHARNLSFLTQNATFMSLLMAPQISWLQINL